MHPRLIAHAIWAASIGQPAWSAERPLGNLIIADCSHSGRRVGDALLIEGLALRPRSATVYSNVGRWSSRVEPRRTLPGSTRRSPSWSPRAGGRRPCRGWRREPRARRPRTRRGRPSQGRIWAMARLEVAQADVTGLEVDAIANAANTELKHGGGVAAAISRAGGPVVQRESDERAPIGLGEAVRDQLGRYARALRDPCGHDGARRADLGGDHRAGHPLDAGQGRGAWLLVAGAGGVRRPEWAASPSRRRRGIMVGAAREHEGTGWSGSCSPFTARRPSGRFAASCERRAGAGGARLVQGHPVRGGGGRCDRQRPARRRARRGGTACGRRRRGHDGRASGGARRRAPRGHGRRPARPAGGGGVRPAA